MLVKPNYIVYTSVNTKPFNIVTLDDGDGMSPSGLHHVVHYSPFSAGGAELQNIVNVNAPTTFRSISSS